MVTFSFLLLLFHGQSPVFYTGFFFGTQISIFVVGFSNCSTVDSIDVASPLALIIGFIYLPKPSLALMSQCFRSLLVLFLSLAPRATSQANATALLPIMNSSPHGLLWKSHSECSIQTCFLTCFLNTNIAIYCISKYQDKSYGLILQEP